MLHQKIIQFMQKKAVKEKHRSKKTGNIQNTKVKMADINSTTSLMILNMFKLSNLIKRQRFSTWVKKNDPFVSYLKEIYS